MTPKAGLTKGKYVSRAVYAKLQGENHRLKKDLRTIAMGPVPATLDVIARWRKVFRAELELNDAIRDYLQRNKPVKK